MKKITLILFLAVCAMLHASAAENAVLLSETLDGGDCGNGLIWRLDVDGVFTVSGRGAMDDYKSQNTVPWRKYRVHIEKVNIEFGVTHIGDYAFIGCPALTALTVPESVRTIGTCAFANCDALYDIALTDGLREIRDLAFSGCSAMTSFPLPKTVTALGQSAFSHCTSLTEFEIIGKLTETRTYLFSGCTALQSVKLPDSVETIGQRTFSGCTSLTDIELPESVSVIAPYAFENCTSLRSFTLPYGITELDNGTFSGCAALKSVGIPVNVRNIKRAVFEQCNALRDVYYTGTESQWNAVSMTDFREQIARHFIEVHYGQREPVSDAVIESITVEKDDWRVHVKITGNPQEQSTLLVAAYDDNGCFVNLESYAVSDPGVYIVALADQARLLNAFLMDSAYRPEASRLQYVVPYQSA